MGRKDKDRQMGQIGQLEMNEKGGYK